MNYTQWEDTVFACTSDRSTESAKFNHRVAAAGPTEAVILLTEDLKMIVKSVVYDK